MSPAGCWPVGVPAAGWPRRLGRGTGGPTRLARPPPLSALAALVAGLIEAGSHGWASWPVAAGLIVAVLASTAFAVTQRPAGGPGTAGRGPPC